MIGEGIEKDYTKSRKYLELSIFKYKGDVLNILGLIYLYGLDADINYTKAKNILNYQHNIIIQMVF